MMQEIKTEEKNFPFNEFNNIGYTIHLYRDKRVIME